MVSAVNSFSASTNTDTLIDLKKDLEKGIRTGNLKWIKEILEIDNSLDEPLPNGLLPLNMAVCENRQEIVTLLLEKGADPQLRDSQNLNAIDHAALTHPELLKTILGFKLGKELNDLLKVKPGFLQLQEMKERAQKLILVTPITFMNMSEISRQAFTGQLAQKSAVDSEEDLNAFDENGLTPIHYAILGNQLASLEWLIEKGADLDATDREGNSLLHFAALKGSKDILDCLIQAGLDPNIQNDQGDTPMHFAALRDDLSTVEILSKAGATLDLRNQYDHSPLALIGSSSSERDPLKLNPLQLLMFATASVNLICQMAATSGWLSDTAAVAAANVAVGAAFISHMMEFAMVPGKNQAMHLLMQIMRTMSVWIEIPVRTYSLYYLGVSTLQGLKACMNNLYRKKAVAFNVFVHAVNMGQSLQVLANKCKLAWYPEKPPAAPIDLSKELQEGAEKYEVCKALHALEKQQALKYHPDKGGSHEGFLAMKAYFDSLFKLFGCEKKQEILTQA